MFKLVSKFNPAGDQPKAIQEIDKSLGNNNRFQTLLGVTGSGKTFVASNIITDFKKPTLVIAPNKVLAAQLYREYKSFFPENRVCYFVSYYDYYQPEAYIPSSDTYIGKESMINEEIDRMRHSTTSSLLSRNDTIVVASVSCIYNLGLPSNYFESAVYLSIGDLIKRDELISQLVRINFERTKGDLIRGTFRVRGDLFEIRPASGEIIYRVELDKTNIISISIIDENTRSIKERLKKTVIFPSKHFISTKPERERAIDDIKKELKERVSSFKKEGKWLEAERLQRRTENDMALLETLGYCHGIENYSRHLTGKLPGEPPDSLLSYFPQKGDEPDFLTIIDESHITIPQIRGMYEGDKSRKEILIEYGFRLPSALDNRPLKFDEFLERVGPILFLSATPGKFEMEKSAKIIEQIIRPTFLVDPEIEIRPVFDKERNKSQIDDLMEEAKLLGEGKMIINTLTKRTAEELDQFLKEKGFKSNFMHSDTKTLKRAEMLTDFRRGEFNILIGVNLLREGLDLPEVSMVAILDADREGFLRSRTSLIQLMGRAARNLKGKVIIYADRITGSMKAGMDEAQRRRFIQEEYNRKNGVKPKGIKKEILNLIDIENE
ncbi:MAG: excinuclease ABC subunit UvrB [Minisyncoccales bacterium]|jgi:excinuclease ABC subunit B